MNELICRKELRRDAVRQRKNLNGLDYLEVGKLVGKERTLTVYFLGKAPVSLQPSNVIIEGGRRIRDIKVKTVKVTRTGMAEFDDYMEVVTDKDGDFSTYTLRIVDGHDENGVWKRHRSFDARYDRVEFSFKVDCPSDLDCKQEAVCPPEKREEPEINYLAKDYGSFRQLILDRLALLMPDWQERHVPDMGITLVELFAYVGDHLSYYQDAVATEAYLDTARQRISVRRHARLVDYPMHEGCNARTWVCVETNSNLTLDPRDIYLITALDSINRVVTEQELQRQLLGSYEIFEPMSETEINLYAGHHELQFYTWCDEECCLLRGATTATLKGNWIEEEPSPTKPRECDHHFEDFIEEPLPEPAPVSSSTGQKLHLKLGDVLILEEVTDPKTGNPADADSKHRHAVRLTDIQHSYDPLNPNIAITEITWAEEDALPFPLCLSAMGPSPQCTAIENISVARSNLILVDHGVTIYEDMDTVQIKETQEKCDCLGAVVETAVIPERYEPMLKKGPLTFGQAIEPGIPATKMLAQDVRQALPKIKLKHLPTMGDGKTSLFSWGDFKDPTNLAKMLKSPSDDISRMLLNKLSNKTRNLLMVYADSQNVPNNLQFSLLQDLEQIVEAWESVRDLLGSHGQDRHFVAEMDNGGRARLRFGDDDLGYRPAANMEFRAFYRVGNGSSGNVGAGSIRHLVTRNTSLSGGIINIRNPLSAVGGTSPEPLAEVKLFAPHTFRKRLERAITPADYAAIVMREFPTKVQRAAASLRWNGSWYEVMVVIDPLGKEEADDALLKDIEGKLYRYRRIGHDLIVKSAQRVALEITLSVCVLPGYLRGHIKAALLEVFSNRMLPDGRLGFFHPDNLTFGDGIYLSKVVATAQSVMGVESVMVDVFHRFNEEANSEIEDGLLTLGPLEIARLDNDPSFPENGLLKLNIGGGR